MKFQPKNARKFQEGGEITAETPQNGAEQQDPIMMLAQAAAQALQTQDCQVAMQVCQGFIQLVQQMAQQQGMSQQGPVEEQQGEPVFKKGGVLSRRIRK